MTPHSRHRTRTGETATFSPLIRQFTRVCAREAAFLAAEAAHPEVRPAHARAIAGMGLRAEQRGLVAWEWVTRYMGTLEGALRGIRHVPTGDVGQRRGHEAHMPQCPPSVLIRDEEAYRLEPSAAWLGAEFQVPAAMTGGEGLSGVGFLKEACIPVKLLESGPSFW